MQHDRNAFRQALGSFATGVTIVTTMAEEPVGVTASSFNSVSLDPPLILWSLAKSSRSINAFRSSGHFAVHVLGAHQESLSNRFAKSGEDKFRDVAWSPGAAGSPILDDHSARFECRTVHRYEGGDHDIFVGEVIAFERRDAPPLVFHGGRYAETRDRRASSGGEDVSLAEGRFTEEFLLYLVSRAHFETSRPTRLRRASAGLSESGFMVLSLLSMGGPLSAEALRAELDHTGLSPDEGTLAELRERGLIAGGDALALTAEGRAAFIPILAAAKAVEDELAARFTPTEIEDTKVVLRRLIHAAHTLPAA